MIDGATQNATVGVARQDLVAAAMLALVLLACSAYRVTPGVSGVYLQHLVHRDIEMVELIGRELVG